MVTLCCQQLWSDTKVKQEATLVYELFLFETRMFQLGVWGGFKCRNRISSANFCIVLHSN